LFLAPAAAPKVKLRQMENTTHRLLGVGVHRLGKDELARRLNATAPVLDAWMAGQLAMPHRKVLSLVDLIEELGALGDQADET